MISTPYKALARILGQPDSWQPSWAQHLQVHRTDDSETVYTAQPDSLDGEAVTELQHLAAAGWRITIDGPRLGRLRIQLAV